jgi:hypothetical protein
VNRTSFEEIGRYLRDLLIRLDDRIPARDFVVITEFIDVGEFGLALEHTADALSEAGVPVTDDERTGMLRLARRMQTGDRVSRALDLCPSLDDNGL